MHIWCYIAYLTGTLLKNDLGGIFWASSDDCDSRDCSDIVKGGTLLLLLLELVVVVVVLGDEITIFRPSFTL